MKATPYEATINVTVEVKLELDADDVLKTAAALKQFEKTVQLMPESELKAEYSAVFRYWTELANIVQGKY